MRLINKSKAIKMSTVMNNNLRAIFKIKQFTTRSTNYLKENAIRIPWEIITYF